MICTIPWITPAWAGKRTPPARAPQAGPDHPRMGGEKPSQYSGFACSPGSPPHGRGKGRCLLGLPLIVGITPAWAGKSSAGQPSQRVRRDHPRMGGEKQTHPPETGRPLGSPPHGRGKGLSSMDSSSATGITPAWAGKRFSPFGGGWVVGDHPRMGGEKQMASRSVPTLWGSPPHGRGKGHLAGVLIQQGGITPAWAGKSSARGCSGQRCRDHPRMGGEK